LALNKLRHHASLGGFGAIGQQVHDINSACSKLFTNELASVALSRLGFAAHEANR
jgi:hypothetical protein